MLDHPRDLQADFRAIYHLGWKEALALPGPELMGLAYRLTVYPGVMAARVADREREERRNVAPGATVVAESDPVLNDVIQFG